MYTSISRLHVCHVFALAELCCGSGRGGLVSSVWYQCCCSQVRLLKSAGRFVWWWTEAQLHPAHSRQYQSDAHQWYRWGVCICHSQRLLYPFTSCEYWSVCAHIRWRRTLWACRWLHGPGGAGLQVGGTFWCFRCELWSAGLTKEMASGGSGTELDTPNIRSTWSQTTITAFFILFHQVDSLSVNPGPEGLPELMVSQPGCGYAILMCSWTQEGAAGPGEENTASPSKWENHSELLNNSNYIQNWIWE